MAYGTWLYCRPTVHGRNCTWLRVHEYRYRYRYPMAIRAAVYFFYCWRLWGLHIAPSLTIPIPMLMRMRGGLGGEPPQSTSRRIDTDGIVFDRNQRINILPAISELLYMASGTWLSGLAYATVWLSGIYGYLAWPTVHGCIVGLRYMAV